MHKHLNSMTIHFRGSVCLSVCLYVCTYVYVRPECVPLLVGQPQQQVGGATSWLRCVPYNYTNSESLNILLFIQLVINQINYKTITI